MRWPIENKTQKTHVNYPSSSQLQLVGRILPSRRYGDDLSLRKLVSTSSSVSAILHHPFTHMTSSVGPLPRRKTHSWGLLHVELGDDLVVRERGHLRVRLRELLRQLEDALLQRVQQLLGAHHDRLAVRARRRRRRRRCHGQIAMFVSFPLPR